MLSEFPVWFMKISIMTVLIFTYFLNFQKLKKKKLWVNLPKGSKFVFHVNWAALFEYEIAFSTRYINGLLLVQIHCQCRSDSVVRNCRIRIEISSCCEISSYDD